MAPMLTTPATTIRRHVTDEQLHARLLDEVRTGLVSEAPWLPTRLLYLGLGGRRFEAVAGDPRYRLARREQALLRRHARTIMQLADCSHVLELGGGASEKLATLVASTDAPLTVTAVDVDEPGVVRGLDMLATSHSHVRDTEAIIGDMLDDSHELPRHGRRLAALLGSTLGNFDEQERTVLLRSVASSSESGDALLLGLDVNGRGFDQFFAYSSDAISNFNREAFTTLGALLAEPLTRDDVDHRVEWSDVERAVRVQLVPRHTIELTNPALGDSITIRAGVPITTAVSRKPRPDTLDRELAAAGFDRTTWWFDDSTLHAVVLARSG